MIVAIDSGNTLSKLGVFKDGTLDKIYEKRSYTDLINLVRKMNPQRVIISSVKIPITDFEKDLPAGIIFRYDHNTPLPINLRYTTPETLGLDRIALAAGAYNLFPGKNILVISAGTCITYDFINGIGEYLGGSISPGLHLRLRALHDFTANLPLVEIQEEPPVTGNSTKNAILSGVIHGTISEISGFIEYYQNNFSDIHVIFSGGDVNFFESKLKGRIFAIPNLVLKGIYSIFSYNEKPT